MIAEMTMEPGPKPTTPKGSCTSATVHLDPLFLSVYLTRAHHFLCHSLIVAGITSQASHLGGGAIAGCILNSG